MNRSAIATAVALGLGVSNALAVSMSSATVNFYDPGGNPRYEIPLPVTGSIGGGTWSISPIDFYSYTMSFHDGTIFAPGTYTIDTYPNGSQPPGSYVFVVGTGQVGGHILWDWGDPSTVTSCGMEVCNTDTIEVWDVSTSGGVTTYTPTDPAAWRKDTSGATTVLGPDGIPGTPFIDGFLADFDSQGGYTGGDSMVVNFTTAVPAPAAVWLFGSGLAGLSSVARSKRRRVDS